MSDYPIGVFRSATCGQTISNWAGASGTKQGGNGAVRVFMVHLVTASGASSTSVTLYNGLSSSDTSNAYMFVAANTSAAGQNTLDLHSGILFPNGCFIATNAAIGFATVMFRTEVL